jgi:hypothetical protein
MHLFDSRTCEEGKERRKEEKPEKESFFELVELDKGYEGVTVVKRNKRTHAKR